MMSTLRVWSKLIVFAFILVFHFIHLMLSSSARGKNIKKGFQIRANFCRSAVKALGIKVNTKNIAQHLGVLFISNHRSMLDPLIELRYIHTYILSKAEVGDYPVIGKGAKETGVLFVDRHIPDSRRAALEAIEKHLVAGQSVMIYPEGTTYGGDLTGDFRKGTFDIAARNSIPVVPIMIEYPNSSYYWTDGSLMEYFRRIFSKPQNHLVTLEMGERIISNNADELLTQTVNEIHAMMVTARNSYQGIKT